MKMKKSFLLTLIVLTLSLILTACGGSEPKQAATEKEGIVTGLLDKNILESDARDYWLKNNEDESVTNKVEYKQYASLNTMLMELKAGKIDVLEIPDSVANYILAQDDSLLHWEGKATQHYHMAARSEDKALTDEISMAIDELKADGTIESLVKEYITDAKGDPSLKELTNKDGKEKHIVAVTGDLPPMDYVSADGTPSGFNVALLNAISEKTDCTFEIVQMEASARLSALEGKKIDLIFWIGCYDNENFEPSMKGVSLTTSFYDEAVCRISGSQDVMEKAKAIYQDK